MLLDVLKGVPVYPLYKRLALSHCYSILNGGLCMAYKELVSLHKDQSIKMKEGNDLDKLFLEKGSVLLNVTLHIQLVLFLVRFYHDNCEVMEFYDYRY